MTSFILKKKQHLNSLADADILDLPTTTCSKTSSSWFGFMKPPSIHCHGHHEGIEDFDYEDLPAGASTLTHLTAGAFAGILEHTVAFPLDLVKTRMQVITCNHNHHVNPVNPVNPHSVHSAHSHSHPHHPHNTYNKGIFDAFRTISSQEGLRKLWRGVSSVIVGAGPAHAIFYASYEFTKFHLTQSHHYSHNNFLATGISGMTAAALSDAFMNPFDVIKQRMQLPGSVYRSSWHCARSIWAKEGLRAFYLSYPTTLLLSVPFNAVQFSVYEEVKHVLNPNHEYDPISHVTSGAVAGAIAAGVTTPIDVMKTLLQTRTTSADPAIQRASGLADAWKLIYRYDGFKGFFRGIQPRVLSYVPSTAICWTVYEYFKYFLGYNYHLGLKEERHGEGEGI